MACSAILAAGCVSTGGGFLRSAAPAEPWRLPPDAYPSQRLYRVDYSGPEGDFGFKLTLYLEAEERYRMAASDLGRKLWTLSVDGGGEAVWLDHRRKRYCRTAAASQLRFVPLADLPLVALPKLLLGRLPAAPGSDLAQGETAVSFLDARGLRWNGQLEDGQLAWWTLLDGGEPVIWWRREERGGVFTDRPGRQEVRWREVVSERLTNPLGELEIPAWFERGDCVGVTAIVSSDC